MMYLFCVKGKVNRAPQKSVEGAHLPLLGLEPVGGEPLMSVMRGQCYARPTVTFPAARHHRPLAGTNLFCLVTEAHVSFVYIYINLLHVFVITGEQKLQVT